MQLQNYDIKTNSANPVHSDAGNVVVDAPLGIYANNVSTTDTQKVTDKPQRTNLFNVKKKISEYNLAYDRVHDCCRKPLGSHVEIHYNHKFNSAKVANVETCASVWACPVCRTKIMSGRADQLKHISEAFRGDGGKTMMITFTVPHYINQALKKIIGSSAKKTGLSGALRRMRSHRAFQELKKSIKYVSDVRALEVTHGTKNGWHAHIHMIVFYDGDVPLMEIENKMYDLWRNACVMAGLSEPGRDHGVKVTDSEAEYLAKWGAPNELSSQGVKEAKNGNKTIVQLENDLLSDNPGDAKRLLREYYKTMKGCKLLTWGGQNIRKTYLDEEQTDQELANDDHGDGEKLFVIDLKTWIMIYNIGVAELLNNVEADKDGGIYKYCEKHNIDPGGVVRLIKQVDTSELAPSNKFEFKTNNAFYN